MIVWCRITWLSTEPSAYFTRRIAGGDLDGLGDRDAQRTGVVRVGLEVVLAGLGQVRRRAVHGGAERLDHHPAVGLLVEGGADLPHLALEAEQGRGEAQRGAPLAGTGLGGELADAGLRVVVRLRHRGVHLVRPGRADALVLVVDARRRAEGLLELVGTVQRRGPPLAVDVEDLAGDLDVPLGGDLLQDQVHREQRLEGLRADRLVRAGVQRRGRRLGQVGDQVVPGRGHLILGEDELVGARRRGHGGKVPNAGPARRHGSPTVAGVSAGTPRTR